MHLSEIPTKEGEDHASNPRGISLGRSWCSSRLVNSYIPMAGSIKSILNAVVVIAVVLWLLSVFGLIGELQKIRVGK